MFCLLTGRGRLGDEESGSKGGRRVGAGRLEPARVMGFMTGSVGSVEEPFLGEEARESIFVVEWILFLLYRLWS